MQHDEKELKQLSQIFRAKDKEVKQQDLLKPAKTKKTIAQKLVESGKPIFGMEKVVTDQEFMQNVELHFKLDKASIEERQQQ